MADYKAGNYVLLKRNPNYWKHDAAGHQLPYIETLWLDIQSNRDVEALRFKRGEIQFINQIDTDYYERLNGSIPAALHDAGPSLDAEQMWFNQVAKAPLPAYKLAWFRSQKFLRAVSASVATLCHRVAIVDQGRVAECAPTQEVFERPSHPYTRQLVAAQPRLACASFAEVL